jgi:hypothetical protein
MALEYASTSSRNRMPDTAAARSRHEHNNVPGNDKNGNSSENATSHVDEGENYSVDIRSLMSIFQARPADSSRRNVSASRQRELGKKYTVKAYNSPEIKRKSFQPFDTSDTAEPSQSQGSHKENSASVHDSDNTAPESVNGNVVRSESVEEFEDYFDKTSYAERFSSSRALFLQYDKQLESSSAPPRKPNNVVDHDANAMKSESSTKHNFPAKVDIIEEKPRKESSSEEQRKRESSIKQAAPPKVDVVEDIQRSGPSSTKPSTPAIADVVVEEPVTKVKSAVQQYSAPPSTNANLQQGAKVKQQAGAQSIPAKPDVRTSGAAPLETGKSQRNGEQSFAKGASAVDKNAKASVFTKPPVKTADSGNANKDKMKKSSSVDTNNEEFVAADVREKLKVNRLSKKYDRSMSAEEEVAKPSVAVAVELERHVQVDTKLADERVFVESAPAAVVAEKFPDSPVPAAVAPHIHLSGDAHLLLDEVERKNTGHEHHEHAPSVAEESHAVHAVPVSDATAASRRSVRDSVKEMEHESGTIDSYREVLRQSRKGERIVPHTGDDRSSLHRHSAHEEKQPDKDSKEKKDFSIAGAAQEEKTANAVLPASSNQNNVNAPEVSVSVPVMEKVEVASTSSHKKLEKKASLEEIDAALKMADNYWQSNGAVSPVIKSDAIVKSSSKDDVATDRGEDSRSVVVGVSPLSAEAKTNAVPAVRTESTSSSSTEDSYEPEPEHVTVINVGGSPEHHVR